MQNIYIKELFRIKIGKFEWIISETHLGIIIIMMLLIGFSYYINRKLKHFEDVPKGIQNFVELVVETFNKFTVSTMGEKGRKFAAYFATLFIFILVSNISGVFNLRPPTADYAVPFGLAIITFFMVQFYGIKEKGVGAYLKGFTQPLWPMTPINVIGEISNPISLSFRLFGNIIGGTILMALYYSQLPWIAQIGIPSAFHFYFDLFAGVLQAFVFTMLSMVFVSGAIEVD
ncbi:MAG: F0F1 ATP synthase subunit A [Eubacteriales bacterium]